MHRSTRRLFLCFAVLALSKAVLAQSPFRVEDINVNGVQPSAPATQLTGLGTNLFFVYDDGVHGREIWKSDGTSAGTALLIDLCPGVCSSAPRPLTVSNGALFFAADDGVHGTELWKSDGTAGGTVLVKDIHPGMRGSFPGIFEGLGFFGGFLDVDGVLFFAADDGENGRELWRSDGTPGGTVLVRDIHPGPSGSDPRLWAAGDGALLLNADDGTHGREPWVSDGTVAGTILLEDINPDGSSTFGDPRPAGNPDAIAAPGGGFLFTAIDSLGAELWKTDGTPAGTTLLKDIAPGFGSGASGFAILGSMIYFSATDDVHGRELWKTDGTEAGTVLAKDINPGLPDSSPNEITPSGGRLFFHAFDPAHGNELWGSDGTAAGTLVIDIVPGPTSGLSFPPHSITAFAGGVLFFNEGLQLWRSDGTLTGTVEVPGSQYPLAAPFDEDTWAVVDGSFFFSTFGSSFSGPPELYVSNGIQSELVLTGPPSPPWSLDADNLFLPSRHPFVAQGDRFLFLADQANTFFKPWASDATPAGTILLSDAPVGGLTPAGGLTFLGLGPDLGITDGTPGGTQVLVSSVKPAGGSAALGSSLIYSCGDGSSSVGTWLCKSDGTSGGTGLITDALHVNPFRLTASGSNVFFFEGDRISGWTLWKTDGTEEGTLQIRDWTGSDAFPDRLTDVAGTLFFSASTESEGRELWKSDGTAAGTVLVEDIRPGQGSSIEQVLNWGGATVAVGGTLFFVADDGTSGRELWKSDGTAAGTVLVKDVASGSTSSDPFWLTRVGSQVYFAADDSVHGRELWVSDGTAAGTRMVADLLPGERSSMPQHLEAVGDLLAFAALHPSGGLEPWRSNGTALGTRLLGDIAPGSLPSSPFAFTRAGSHVFFGANDTTTGFEPWAVPLSNVLATFSDVPTGHWAWPFVETVAGAGLTGGCGPGQYCPDQAVTRAQVAVFLLRGIHGSGFTPPPATGTVFEDVPAGYWAASWIEQLAAEGLTGGCTANPPRYCPEQQLTRAEMAVLLLKARHGSAYTPPPATGTVFTDVPLSYWAAPWIEQLAAEGITGGCAPGLYCPDNPVTRAEMAVFLTKTFNLPLP